PGFIRLQMGGKKFALVRGWVTIAVDDLAQDGLVDANGFRQFVLAASPAKNLQLQIWKHLLLLCSFFAEWNRTPKLLAIPSRYLSRSRVAILVMGPFGSPVVDDTEELLRIDQAGRFSQGVPPGLLGADDH